jgi:hypothetical protein
MRKPDDFEGRLNSSIEASIAAVELGEEALFSKNSASGT